MKRKKDSKNEITDETSEIPSSWWRSGLRRLMCCRPRLALDNCFRNDRDILGLLSVNLGS